MVKLKIFFIGNGLPSNKTLFATHSLYTTDCLCSKFSVESDLESIFRSSEQQKINFPIESTSTLTPRLMMTQKLFPPEPHRMCSALTSAEREQRTDIIVVLSVFYRHQTRRHNKIIKLSSARWNMNRHRRRQPAASSVAVRGRAHSKKLN